MSGIALGEVVCGLLPGHETACYEAGRCVVPTCRFSDSAYHIRALAEIQRVRDEGEEALRRGGGDMDRAMSLKAEHNL